MSYNVLNKRAKRWDKTSRWRLLVQKIAPCGQAEGAIFRIAPFDSLVKYIVNIVDKIKKVSYNVFNKTAER